MSRAICPKCGNTDVSWIRNDDDRAEYICLECKQSFCYPPKTIFNCITESPAVLAPKLVYDWGHLCHNGDIKIYWKSTILPDAVFYSKFEAHEATLAKLKEVAE